MMDDFIYGEPQMIGAQAASTTNSLQDAVAPGDN